MCMPLDPVCNLLFIEFSCHAVSVLESCCIVLHVHELVSYHTMNLVQYEVQLDIQFFSEPLHRIKLYRCSLG